MSKTRKLHDSEIMDLFRSDEDVGAAMDDYALAFLDGNGPTGEHLLSVIQHRLIRLQNSEVELEDCFDSDICGDSGAA